MDSLRYFTDRLSQVLVDVRRLVDIETPTGRVDTVTDAVDELARMLAGLGEVERIPLASYGPALRLRRTGTGPRVLMVGHVDTVWPVGSWQSTWREIEGRVVGPGVYDMKAALVFVPWLLRWLADSGRPAPPIEVIFNPDEEIGSLGSRPILEEAARRADLALVLEPTVADGCLKVARKGSGEYRFTIHGKASHQGVEPDKGVNAVVEGARLALELASLADPPRGTTVGPNVIRGGTASNVVADRCELRVDVRVWNHEERERLDDAIRSLQLHLPGTRLEVEGGWNRPPFEPTEASMAVYGHAAAAGRKLGITLHAARWGGSSDANILAAAGIPTVDGFGPVGDGAHDLAEHIVVAELPRRMALLAETITDLADLPEGWPRVAAVRD